MRKVLITMRNTLVALIYAFWWIMVVFLVISIFVTGDTGTGR